MALRAFSAQLSACVFSNPARVPNKSLTSTAKEIKRKPPRRYNPYLFRVQDQEYLSPINSTLPQIMKSVAIASLPCQAGDDAQ
jgi:hypothetical protein